MNIFINIFCLTIFNFIVLMIGDFFVFNKSIDNDLLPDMFLSLSISFSSYFFGVLYFYFSKNKSKYRFIIFEFLCSLIICFFILFYASLLGYV